MAHDLPKKQVVCHSAAHSPPARINYARADQIAWNVTGVTLVYDFIRAAQRCGLAGCGPDTGVRPDTGRIRPGHGGVGR